MMKGDHGQTNQLHDINWGALDLAFCAPQLMSCNNLYSFVCMQCRLHVLNGYILSTQWEGKASGIIYRRLASQTLIILYVFFNAIATA